jgi:phospholipase C
MSRKQLLKSSGACLAVAAMLNSTVAVATSVREPTLTVQPTTTSYGYTSGLATVPSKEGPLSPTQKLALLKQNIKYVFVIFQENRSFDHFFGTFPGANGLFGTYAGANPTDIYAQPATAGTSFHQVVQDTTGNFITLTPFLAPRQITNATGQTVQLYPESLYSVGHGHASYLGYFHYDQATETVTKNDAYALGQEGLHYSGDATTTATIVNGSGVAPTTAPTLRVKQEAEVDISHIDCDTNPIYWQYADQFTLFDNFHQTAIGPSTPNAIAMIAGQTGDTQWVKHPGQADPVGLTLPNENDSVPFPGSANDMTGTVLPFGPDDSAYVSATNSFAPDSTTQVPLTFASLPLSFAGSNVFTLAETDRNPATDLGDVQHDLKAIYLQTPVSWGWYQQGWGPEPFDGASIHENGGSFNYTVAPAHASLVTHHVGPQYFGYVGDNPAFAGNLHGLQQFYTDVANNNLPAAGGVFYVRGGYYNNDGLLPADPNPVVQAATPGNDDHPNYSDAQISAAMVADTVNAIATSKYWANSAIIISYDETDGEYDHVPEQFRTFGPDGHPETGGPRIPTIVISPFAATHVVSHVYSEHSSIIRFIDLLFGLRALGNLPDEAAARKLGASTPAFNNPYTNAPQTNLGPADSLGTIGDLFEAFDNDRLTGKKQPLPASYAEISPAVAHTLPQYSGQGCTALGITPTDYPHGYSVGGESDPPPLDFNPRPTQSPGSPYYNTNNNTGGTSTGNWPG